MAVHMLFGSAEPIFLCQTRRFGNARAHEFHVHVVLTDSINFHYMRVWIALDASGYFELVGIGRWLVEIG